MESSRGILQGHKRIGKRFIPAITSQLPLTEVSWVDDILPELVWLQLLSDTHGLRRGIELAVQLAQAVQSVTEAFPALAYASTYSTLTGEQWAKISETLGVAVVADVQRALRPLVALYPTCPFSGLWGADPAEQSNDDVETMKEAVRAVLDRRGRSATLIQGTATCIAFATGQLQVFAGSQLANLNALSEYPNTSESRMVASAVRAHMNAGANWDKLGSSTWPADFWRRGVEFGTTDVDTTHRAACPASDGRCPHLPRLDSSRSYSAFAPIRAVWVGPDEATHGTSEGQERSRTGQ